VITKGLGMNVIEQQDCYFLSKEDSVTQFQ